MTDRKKMKEFVYVNGRLIPREKALVSAFDYGLLYGYGVFESMRAYNGRVFKLGEHLERLRRSARAVGIEHNGREIPRVIKRLLARNKLEDAYVRVTLTAGVGKPRLALDGRQKPTLIVFVGKAPKRLFGVRVGYAKVRHYSRNPLSRHKTTNYLQTALRKKEAKERRLDDVIVLNEKNHVVEASTSNLFMVDGRDTLITPRIQDGCLPGITRQTILETARKLGIKTTEKTITPKELQKAREVFLTNSVTGVTPVKQMGKTKFKTGKITKKLQKEYKKLTGL